MAQDGNPWWITVLASVPSLGAGVWAAKKYFDERADKQHTEELTREQMLMRDLDAQRAASSKEALEVFERVKSELARRDIEAMRQDERIESLEKKIDYWVSVARGWQTRCFSVRHQLNNARLEINALLAKAGRPEQDWIEVDLPASLEEPRT